MADRVVATPRNGGNGAVYPAPLSPRAFFDSVPGRLAALEDAVEVLKLHLGVGEVKKPAAVVSDPALTARVDNLAEHVGRLTEKVRLVDGRSRRTRRHPMHIADHSRTKGSIGLALRGRSNTMTRVTDIPDVPDLGAIISLLMDWQVLAAEIKRRVDDLPLDLRFEMEELNQRTDEITNRQSSTLE